MSSLSDPPFLLYFHILSFSLSFSLSLSLSLSLLSGVKIYCSNYITYRIYPVCILYITWQVFNPVVSVVYIYQYYSTVQ